MLEIAGNRMSSKGWSLASVVSNSIKDLTSLTTVAVFQYLTLTTKGLLSVLEKLLNQNEKAELFSQNVREIKSELITAILSNNL